MAGRSSPPSLQSLARGESCKLTMNVIKTILLQERNDEVYHRKFARECKRKRSYSCGDAEGRTNVKKKTKTACSTHVTEAAVYGKRMRQDDEDDDDNNKIKRKRIEGPSQEYDSPVTCSSSQIEQQGSKDDVALQYCGPSEERLQALNHHFLSLSPAMWTKYGNSLIDTSLKIIKRDGTDANIIRKAIEHILCAKLLSFSTTAIESCSSELEGVIFDKLRLCRRLVTLEVTVVPRGERDIVAASLSLQRLTLLHSLSLLPASRFSYHWAISLVARHCPALREFKVVYNGDLFEAVNELENLEKCTKLTSLWLFNFGRKSETKQVRQLAGSLTNLKALFHKELPNALLELQGEGGREGRRQLELERVDLCWYLRSVGYQLVYVPSSYLLQAAKACPRLGILNLVGPPCLAQVMTDLQHLRVLVLQQASLTSCLASPHNNLGFSRITELRVSDVWDVTHSLVSGVACGCPNLQVLEIVNSSLEARGELHSPPHRPAFPLLRQATLVPVMTHDRPPLTTPSVWQLGARLTSYLLKGASRLTALHLHYKQEDITDGDVPSAQDLETALTSPRPTLRSLLLEWPPAVSASLVGSVVVACPALATLATITTWPLPSHQRAAIVTQYGRCVDIR